MSWRTFLKWYVRGLAITGLTTLLLLYYPGLVMLGVVLFVVPGLILAFLPTFCTYFLAISAGVFAYDRTRSIGLALPIAAISVAAVAYGLPKYGRYSFDSVTSSYQRKATGVLPTKIGPDIVIQSLPSLHFGTFCTELCQRLLRLAQIDAVYMSDYAGTQVHRLKDRNCSLTERTPSGGTLGHPIGHCFTSETVSLPKDASLTIELVYLKRRDYGLVPGWPARMTDVVRVRFESETEQIAERTYIEGVIPSSPFWVDLGWSSGVPDKWRPASEKTVSWEEQVVRDVRLAIERVSPN